MLKSILLVIFLGINILPQDTSLVNVRIRYKHPAQKVQIAGNFNNWNPQEHTFINKIKDHYIDLKLKPGYYYYKLVVDGNWIPDPENLLKVNDGGTSFNSIMKVGNPPVPVRKKRDVPFPKDKLPEPILTDSKDLIDLYYFTWYLAWLKIMNGNEQSGFAKEFMDEGFNEMIYQWDTCFMVLFGIYSNGIFPAMASIDNFYSHQRSDGYIQRVYNELTGLPVAEPTKDEPMVNPPLFAWTELKYYQVTGDSSRFKIVLPKLIKYFNWIEDNCKTEYGKGLHYTSPLGSGMDNTPRPNVDKAAWIDFSLQQSFAAKCIKEIAQIINEKEIYNSFDKKHKEINNLINEFCWDDKKGFYFDMKTDGKLSPVYHIGSYWSFLSGTADSTKANKQINYLLDTNYFKRPHMVPTLAYSDSNFDPKGHYWLGSVWAPTNYMVIKGLEEYGYNKLADEIAANHLKNINYIYKNFTPDENKIAFEERYQDGYKTIWECYSSEYNEPATRWDNTFYSRQDFAGWTAVGPISLLIENVLGFKLDASINTIYWNINRTDEHGIKNLNFNNQNISLIASPYENKMKIKVIVEKPLKLIVYNKGIKNNFVINKSGDYITY
ncbi:MAG TPA: trehalase family glycosidase [Ignavibacteriaceae bacterium]|nr:trehalase family glycosidase [Ignavibacteriaceae bacterium]